MSKRKPRAKDTVAAPAPPKPAREGTLVEFFARSPLRGSGIKIVRRKDRLRKIIFEGRPDGLHHSPHRSMPARAGAVALAAPRIMRAFQRPR